MSGLPSTPQPPSQILSKGIEIGVNSFSRLFMFTTLAGLASLIPTVYLALRIGDVVATLKTLSEVKDAAWYLIEILCVLAGVLIQAILVLRLDNLVQGGTSQFQVEWQRAVHVLLPLFISSVVFFCTLIVGYVLLIVPGVILTVSLAFFQFCVVLDRQGPIAGLNRSHTLVWGNWWRTFWVLLVMLVIMLLIAMLLLVPVGLLMGFHVEPGSGTGRDLLVQGVLQMIATAVLGPFVLGIMYVQYHDLKTRHALSGNP